MSCHSANQSGGILGRLVGPVELVPALDGAGEDGVAQVVGQRLRDDLREDVRRVHPVLVERDARERRAAESVGLVRPEELQLAPVGVVDAELGLVEGHARNRVGEVLGHVPGCQLRLAVRRQDVGVEPASTQVVQARVRHGRLQRPEAAALPGVVHRGELVVVDDARCLAGPAVEHEHQPPFL